MGPAETVDDVAVVRLELDCPLDERQSLLEVAVLIDPGVAQVVQHKRLIR